jgi:hypothetical protein
MVWRVHFIPLQNIEILHGTAIGCLLCLEKGGNFGGGGGVYSRGII